MKTVKNIVKTIAEKNRANKPIVDNEFVGETGVVGSGWGGELAISPAWGDFGVSQSQEDDICDINNEHVELIGYISTFVNWAYRYSPSASLSTSRTIDRILIFHQNLRFAIKLSVGQKKV